MELLTTNELSGKWGISSRRIAILCDENRIGGAIKKGKTWLIPADAEKPEDARYKKGQINYSRFKNLEKGYRVIYPESANATYTSILNYSDDLDKPFQRWYRYKEGFSIELVKHLILKYSKNPGGIILDPFAGSGSTLLAAKQMGYSGAGFEVNPFSFFLAQCKLDIYSDQEIETFKRQYEEILLKAKNLDMPYQLPELSISEKVFDKQVEKYFMTVDSLISNNESGSQKAGRLLKLGWLACLESVCNYRKAGNGLKIRKYVNPRKIEADDVYALLLEEYQNIYIDLLKDKNNKKSVLYNDSCLNMGKYLKKGSVAGIIFSPPYANCFDYTEIYKLELWFGRFVSGYSQMKELRKQSLHSHLNGDFSREVVSKSEILTELLIELQKKDIWDKKIPKMLQLYYDDMFRVLEESYEVLCEKGFCSIVVGNSAYGGIIFPADLILAEYAERIGFTVDKIEVDRYIITSSQQYAMTKESGKYLRESVLCLIK